LAVFIAQNRADIWSHQGPVR